MFFRLQRITIFIVKHLQKNTIVLTIHILYNCHNQTEHMFYIERNVIMSAKEELKNLILTLTPEELEEAAVIFQKYLSTKPADLPPVPQTCYEHNLTVPFERLTAHP